VQGLLPTAELALAVQSTLAILQCLDAQIQILERTILAKVPFNPQKAFAG